MPATSTALVQQMVTSTGQLLTDFVPVGIMIFGLTIALFSALLIGKALISAGKKLSR